MKYLIWWNFKMNKTNAEFGQYVQQFFDLYHEQDVVDVVICPQMASLSYASTLLPTHGVHLGSQNMHFEMAGAFTGETSPALLQELQCNYVIVWHSERRLYFWEDAHIMYKKLTAAIANGIRPILCIGETLEEKEQWRTKDILTQQLLNATKNLDLSQIDVAYEPVWSIWTGKIPTMEDIEGMHTLIRELVKNDESRILYGWSSNDQNAAEIIKLNNVNWFLVGWASLDPQKFITMITAIVDYLQ